ncbi:MAG: ATP-binding cassette domain-containing protein [Planctomycetia bacterium]|nr:ATP-binding cassette domain-containing protein [Planctomycetia bacterium]
MPEEEKPIQKEDLEDPDEDPGRIKENDLKEGLLYTAEDGSQKILRRRRPLLEVKNMSMQFGQNQVLRNINLQIRRGETVAVIGESGCGKTVLLKTIIGLLWPTSGKIYFDGKNLAKLSSRQLTDVRTRYGFVFQQAALFDSMSIGENISFPIRQNKKKVGRKEMNERVEFLLHEVGLNPDVVNRMPAELSGGMRKRVGFARALVMDPELMLYDEPTTGLDPIMSDVINELIIQARDKHRVTGIIVTHDMKSAMKVADRIVMLYPTSRLNEGEPQILFDGKPEEMETCKDLRVSQFINGEAGERLMEMARAKKTADKEE